MSTTPASAHGAIDASTDGGKRNARLRLRVLAAASLVLLALLTAAATIVWHTGEEQRIAVMPCENLSGDRELDDLAFIAGEIGASLRAIEEIDFTVIPPASAKAVAGSTITAAEMGRQFGADLLVMCPFIGDGEQIRMMAQLVRVADGQQIWDISIMRARKDALALTRDISVAIAEQLRQQLSPEIAAAFARRQTENGEAFRLYLKGQKEWSQVSRKSVSDALLLYEQAVEIDPDYALAWAGIAHALITSPMTSRANREDVAPRVLDALQHALAHGDDLAEAELALAYYRNIVEWDTVGALRAAERSITLDRNNPTAHMLRGLLLANLGEFREAKIAMERARDLNPQYALVFANSAVVASSAGDLHDALDFARDAVVIGPDVWAAHYQLGNVQFLLGDYEAALDSFTEAEVHAGGTSLADWRAVTLARLDRESDARELLAELHATAEHEYISPLSFARVHASLGDADDAFYWLDRAFDVSDNGLRTISRDSMGFEFLDDPRFDEVLSRRDELEARMHPTECEVGC
jgi:tetratricopeptide (TPR) repeat protein